MIQFRLLTLLMLVSIASQAQAQPPAQPPLCGTVSSMPLSAAAIPASWCKQGHPLQGHLRRIATTVRWFCQGEIPPNYAKAYAACEAKLP